MAKRVKNKRQRSAKMIKNDRRNLLRNAEDYIRKMRRVTESIEAHGVKSLSTQNIRELIYVCKKCSETLKKYLRINDKMIEFANKEFAQGFEFTGLSDSERKWLASVDQEAIQIIQCFSSSDVVLKSTKEILIQIIEFRKNLDRLIDIEPTAPEEQEKVKLFGNATRNIAIGVGIICSDGIVYYNTQEQFSAKSIWLGGGLVINGINNLIGKE